jgi:hypothetical protein
MYSNWAFNPSTREAEADRFLNSRPARAIQRNPVSKKKKKKKRKRKEKKKWERCSFVAASSIIFLSLLSAAWSRTQLFGPYPR